MTTPVKTEREQVETAQPFSSSKSGKRIWKLPDLQKIASHKDFKAVASHLQPSLWAAFIATRDPVAQYDLLTLLVEAVENYLPAPAPLAYPSPPAKQQEAKPVEQSSFLIQNGIPYMPLSDASRHTGVHRDTLLHWIKTKAKFNGELIDAIFFKPTGNHFISKRSVEKIASRFERWPSAQPVGAITVVQELGQAKPDSEYLSTADAARVIGVPGGTLRRWVREGSAPVNKALDTVRDTSSGYFYLEHKDVLLLAEHVRKFGVSRGPRATPLSPNTLVQIKTDV